MTTSLSIVTCFFNNPREARRTLYSMSSSYQRAADGLDYEVIAVDNGSTTPLDPAFVESMGDGFRHMYVETAAQSPAAAINAACRAAAGDYLLVLIDGAHIMSPGILHWVDRAWSAHPSAFIGTAGFHIGPKSQNESVLEGYSQTVEDALLERSGWESDGYELFTVSGAFHDGCAGWFGSNLESSCFGVRKDAYFAIGGLDEQFESPGGGLMSLDFHRRMTENLDIPYVMLLGEATFHQFHGGVASNAPRAEHPWNAFHEEYVRIRGRVMEQPWRRPILLGHLPAQALAHLRNSANAGLFRWLDAANQGRLLGPSF